MVKSVDEINYFRRRCCRGGRRPPQVRGGFSFVEILFAVMILGIGFILIAGIFPVAINQTQANGDETIAASMARDGAAVIANLSNTSALMAADGTVHRFGPSTSPAVSTFGDPDLALWNELNGAQVLAEDPRYAWIPFYCRRTDAYGLAADSAQVTIIGVRVRNHAAYIPSTAVGGDEHVTGSGATAAATLIGTPATVRINVSSTAVTFSDQITFVTGGAAAAPGAYVIIANDTGATTTGSAVGWILKVGTPTAASGVYYLQPGGDIKNQSAAIYRPAPATVFNAFIVGQGADPDAPNTVTGGAQDIMAYTTFIPVH